jgi:acyl-coenzyme A thioesterase PaaI-like protein
MDLGRAMRRLHHAVVGRLGDLDDLMSMAVSIDAIAARLEESPVRSRLASMSRNEDLDEVNDGALMFTHGDRPFSGPASPYGFEFEPRRDGDHGVTAVFTLGPAHEGPPGRAHGGLIAGLFDDLTGYVMHVIRVSAYTGELSVRYVAPVPLATPLQARAWMTERVGRKVHIAAEICDGEIQLARCTALYIVAPR